MTLSEPQNRASGKTDLIQDGWVDRWVPGRFRPYVYLMRLDRPIGTWLLLLPGWWSIAAGYSVHPDLSRALFLAALFGVGAVIMRGMGCVVNDLWDRDFDARVTRTRTRPLAAGTITPARAAAFALFLLLLGFLILLCTNRATIWIGVASLPFILLYPLMKRITWWPQAFLGFTFNFGALMGWSAMTGEIALPALLFYVAGFFWTLGYDTIYAQMDRDDDALIGVKSTARLFGPEKSKIMIGIFYMLASTFFGAAFLQIFPVVDACIGTALIAAGFVRQVLKFHPADGPGCLALFKWNKIQGGIVLGVILWGIFRL